MEERIAKLEAIADSTVAAVAALRTDMNERFRLVDTQLAELRRQKVDTELILTRLEAQAIQIEELRQGMDRRFKDTDRRFDQMDRRLEHIERRLDEQAEQIKELRSDLRYMARWLFGTQFAIALFLLGLAAKIFYPS
ncbi:hypothetical protein GTP91_16390 [Rugamonas sp. FT82W]|uniref:DUF1640 domain-containing protein n=1 Tax=Duganella vulcania TaxID=2692166 RepID=A0A845G735_9BURK|nr:hypothetical protein [Duganella vulcania]MYM88747.1 hypothetical protein [Duganella vulcania]